MIPLWVLKALPMAAGAAAVVAAYHFMPIIGPAARIDRAEASRDAWKAKADAWKSAASGWELSFRRAEHLRVEEQVAAIEAQNAAQTQCAARVREARASAKIIKEIAYAPVKADAAGCPVRDVVGTDRLRDALQPGR